MMTVIFIFIAIAAIATIAEQLWPERPKALFRTGFAPDVIHTAVNITLRAVLFGSGAVAVSAWGERMLPEGATGLLRGAPSWVQFVVVVVVLDFCFYWMHRAKHRFNWWWRLHETHHSSAELDWFSSVRFHPLEKILDRVLYLLPLLILGTRPEVLLGLSVLDASVATLAHSNLNLRIGPLIYVFVGPEMHRWHHAEDPERQRHNFGNNLSIFDWIFGTAELPAGRPERFGTGDDAYPHAAWTRQVLYAFRREPQ